MRRFWLQRFARTPPSSCEHQRSRLRELFVIRVRRGMWSAGGTGTAVRGRSTLADPPLFAVLGHDAGCGVQRGVRRKFDGAQERRHIEALLDNITPGLRCRVDPGQTPEA